MSMPVTVPPTTERTTPPWRGINHLALITTDMDATVRFYHGTLGARLVATVGTPEFRHFFFDFGPQCTVAFFEYTSSDVERLAKPAGIFDRRAVQFDHLALNLPDEDALLALQGRLRDSGCEVIEIIDHGSVRSVYFTDPNGIALEASWWARDVTGRPADYNDDEAFGDPNPTAAVEELRVTGTLASVPTTRLS